MITGKTGRRPGVALATLCLLAMLAPLSTASAATRAGLHDARYCEIIVLRGSLPNATAVVYNTIGLNRCPAAWWNGFEANALARELGAKLVVLNGPRHFLMDSVVAKTGGVRSFHGMRLTRVATIPISTAADLNQTPYTDRTIARSNSWRWKRGRTVFELVAPGGDTYVMQSYSQIRDPALSIRKLRALGRRLHLPSGWRYRARRLRKALVLRARGAATITQDELQNTYQLARTTRRPGKRKRHAVSISGNTRTVPPATVGTVEDHGTVTGTPFGQGSIVLIGRRVGGRLEGTFRLLYRRGSVTGTVSLAIKVAPAQISFDGAARLTGGRAPTGASRAAICACSIRTRSMGSRAGCRLPASRSTRHLGAHR